MEAAAVSGNGQRIMEVTWDTSGHRTSANERKYDRTKVC